MSYVIGSIIVLGLLILFHEFGHFVVAKKCGVRVETFSFGFGPKLLSFKKGETEYRISAFPLGGYVKLFGESPDTNIPPQERARAFSFKSPKERILIALAGPIANFLLALVVFMVIGLTGEPKMTAEVPDVVRGSEAWKEGVRSGDTILSISGTSVQRWDEIDALLKKKQIGEKVELRLREAGGEEKRASLAVSESEIPNIFGKLDKSKGLPGVLMRRSAATVGIDDPTSPAAKAGLKTSDLVVAVSATPIETWSDFELAVQRFEGTILPVSIQRGDEEAFKAIEILLPVGWRDLSPAARLPQLGIQDGQFFLREVVVNSPAEKAGLKPGDHILSLDGKKASHWEEFRRIVSELGQTKKPFDVVTVREGKNITITVASGEEWDSQKEWKLGVVPAALFLPPKQIMVRSVNPVTLFITATMKLGNWVALTFRSILMLFLGQISLKMLGGPIMIGKLAGETLQMGLYPFLQILAIISVNLGVLNLLPIPVLDGGHLLFHGIEWVRGKPVRMRTQEIATQIGFAVLVLLLIIVLYNDIIRFWGGLWK